MTFPCARDYLSCLVIDLKKPLQKLKQVRKKKPVVMMSFNFTFKYKYMWSNL